MTRRSETDMSAGTLPGRAGGDSGADPRPRPGGWERAFRGKRVLIAGATSGLGQALARRLAAGGARLALGGRRAGALETLAATLAREAPAGAQDGAQVGAQDGAQGGAQDGAQDGGQGGHVVRCADLTDPEAARDWVRHALDTLGGADALVVTMTAGAATTDDDSLRASFETDLAAPLRLLDACAPALAASRGACLFCSSRSAHEPRPATLAYGAAKAALEYAVRCEAARLARSGVRVNAIAPGSLLLDGGFWDRCREDDPELWRRTLANQPAGRLGTADDILPAMLFLCSDAARWITGQTLIADGGQLLAPYIDNGDP